MGKQERLSLLVLNSCQTYFSLFLNAFPTQTTMDEVLEYIEHKNVRAVFKELMEQVCLHKPDNVYTFIVSYIQDHHSQSMVEKLVKYEDSDNDMGDDDETQDAVGDLPERQVHAEPVGRRRRSAVSAESVSPDELKNKAKKIIAKSDQDRSSIRERLRKNFLFSSLDDDAAGDIVNAIVEMKFTAGDVVVRQGDDGDFFYIIEEGSTHIFVSKDGVEKKVMECGSGDSFGELALMYNAPRAATVKAVTDLRCWAVDRQTFKLTLMESTLKKRDRYEKFLDSVPILDTLYKYEKLTIADALLPQQFKEGDVVTREGDSGENFYIIEKGTVDYTQKNHDGQQEIVGRGKEGDYFGEIALLTNKPRAATVTCTTDCIFLALDRKTFVRVMGPLDNILKRNIGKYKSWVELKQADS
eukprot:c13230_g1_i1.p1 GENE.c13230_g1_i1~~c13230_g1_i1.p1  ORF type:complete len:412 (-),score=92.89 c13230_g1_i1:350-1585(-)